MINTHHPQSIDLSTKQYKVEFIVGPRKCGRITGVEVGYDTKAPRKRLQHSLQLPFDFVELECWKRLPPLFNRFETCWKVLKRSRIDESELKPFAPFFQHCFSSGQISDGQSQSFFRRNHFVTTKDLFSSYIFFDIAQDTLKIGITDSHNFFVFRCIFDRQFLYNVVEIIIPFPPFFWSTALFFPFLDFYLHHTTLQKLQKRLISYGHCWKYLHDTSCDFKMASCHVL